VIVLMNCVVGIGIMYFYTKGRKKTEISTSLHVLHDSVSVARIYVKKNWPDQELNLGFPTRLECRTRPPSPFLSKV
jgi:hypothetical protein